MNFLVDEFSDTKEKSFIAWKALPEIRLWLGFSESE